jgi:hypothetical protein
VEDRVDRRRSWRALGIGCAQAVILSLSFRPQALEVHAGDPAIFHEDPTVDDHHAHIAPSAGDQQGLDRIDELTEFEGIEAEDDDVGLAPRGDTAEV